MLLLLFPKDEADDFFPANGRLLFVQHLRSAFRPFSRAALLLLLCRRPLIALTCIRDGHFSSFFKDSSLVSTSVYLSAVLSAFNIPVDCLWT
jgi:hypothetical protein